jgi:glyoxylase-like metal-dependent hydrolase (beta-lactamase superfamily II)
MSPLTRQFGAYAVTILHDGVFEAPATNFIHTAGEEAREAVLARWAQPTFAIPVHCFLLDDGREKILVDAGTGTAWGDCFGHARSALARMGLASGDIARVLLTHLHGDHALGLFDGLAAYLPNAEIVVPAIELAHFTSAEARAAAPEERRSGFRIAGHLLTSYAGRIRTCGEEEIQHGITALALPGHTPGQHGYRVDGGENADDLLLWGDALHVPALQGPDPAIGLAFDLAPAVASRTRRAVLTRAAKEGWIVAGGHVEGFCRVMEDGDGFSLRQVAEQAAPV